jgi:hypothetical protein
MGLDMYVYARRHVTGYDFYEQEEQVLYRGLVEAVNIEDAVSLDTPTAEIEVCVGYWRKANAIHEWFVREVQNGVDECQRSEVSREQLTRLRDLCLKVLGTCELVAGQVYTGTQFKGGQAIEMMEEGRIVADPAVAQEHLPTQAGFFFGNTDYNEWYVEDLKNTVKQIDRMLTLDDRWYLAYQASW